MSEGILIAVAFLSFWVSCIYVAFSLTVGKKEQPNVYDRVAAISLLVFFISAALAFAI